MQKEKYVFVAHCGPDAQTAGRVTYYLRERDLRVWYESWDTYANLGDEAFIGELQGTSFLLPVISGPALENQAPGREVWLNWLRMAEEEGIQLVPVLTEEVVLEKIPEQLREKRMIRLGHSFESDLNELIFATALDQHNQQVKKRERLVVPSPELQVFQKDSESDLASAEWPLKTGYKQVVITPVRPIKEVPLESLAQTMTNCITKVSGWSGPSFPFPLPLKAPSFSRKKSTAYVDRHGWIGERFSFHYWHVSTSGSFLYRQHLYEDHSAKSSGEYLSPDWLLLWITESLRFAQKLVARLGENPDVRLELLLHGMKGRKLLWPSRFCVSGEYCAADDDISVNVRIGAKSDLVGTATEIAEYIFNRFGLSRPPADALKRSLTLLCDGRYYKLEI